MKRFWLVMLSLGLVLAFSASAMAVDVKFSGSFYAAGMYLDKTSLVDNNGSTGDNVSTAFYYQRLRVGTEFIVSPGLKLVTRFDAMERVWGAARTSATAASSSMSSGTMAETENIAFDLAYLSYTSPIGLFKVGYINDNTWGTVFGDSNINGGGTGGIEWVLPIGNFVIGADIYKESELSKTAKLTTTKTDNDVDKYDAFAIWNINKDINVGLIYVYFRNASLKGDSAPATGSLSYVHAFIPYAKAKIGPVSLETELAYAFGNKKAENGTANADVSLSELTFYVNAVADFGMFYAGGTFAFISGDDPATSDKTEGSTFLTGGRDWNPTLIMFNQDLTYWSGALPGYNSTTNGSDMTNAWFGQGKIGVRPIPALDVNLSVAYAAADKKPSNILNSAYGWEVDLTGTYKITNNLSYMLGAAYLFTGDYYKGTSNANTLRNDYLLINKLTLTF